MCCYSHVLDTTTLHSSRCLHEPARLSGPESWLSPPSARDRERASKRGRRGGAPVRSSTMTKTVNRYEQDLAVELLEAVRTGNRRGVATLLMAGASVNGLPEADARPLLLAAESGDVRKMHVLIEKGADVNAGAFRRRDRGGRRKGEGQLVEGTRPMHLAVKTGNKNAVRLLLSAGANPSLADKRGLTPLMSACRVCNGFRVARELLRAGADACSADRNGSTAAHYAAREGHEDLLELVLAKAPVALSQPDRDGRTPLFVAAANGRGGAVRRLLALGAKQPAAGGASVGTRCPLQEAVRRNDGEVTRILVDQGMEAIGGGASAKIRAMETAAEAGRAKILQVLLAVQEGERVGYGDAMHCVQRQRARSASSGWSRKRKVDQRREVMVALTASASKREWGHGSAKVAGLGVVLVVCFLAWRPGDLEIRIRHDRRDAPHEIKQIQERRWNEGGLLSPQPPRLEGQEVEGENHRRRRAVEIEIQDDTEERASTEVWTLLGENTTIADCPRAPHVSIPAAEHDSPSIDPVSADDVWAKLEQAGAERHNCPTEQCCQGKHVHTYRGGDLGEEMSHVRGAVVVQRPDLARTLDKLSPAPGVDFVQTLQSYFSISESSLLRPMIDAHAQNKTSETPVYQTFGTLLGVYSFMDAVQEGYSAAGELLTPYCTNVEGDQRKPINECLRTPAVVSMADVYINKAGFVWNDIDFVAPIACRTREDVKHTEKRQRMASERREHVPTASYDKVFVMTQEWGPNYYHFLVEHLPRIMVMLDVLLLHEDIKIAVHHHGADAWHDTSNLSNMHLELMELLGINRDRIITVFDDEIHADLAILPTTTICGDPDPHLINMLRHSLLQALYPSTGGVPPAPPRPVIVLVVRESLRGLANSDEVKEALDDGFPTHDVVEFRGAGSIRSQLETFATASLVVAPHGAGLANIVVSALHTPVLEIGSIQCPPCFLRLALKLHHVYARHTGGEWDLECIKTWLEPDADEVVALARDMLEGKRQADEATEALSDR